MWPGISLFKWQGRYRRRNSIETEEENLSIMPWNGLHQKKLIVFNFAFSVHQLSVRSAPPEPCQLRSSNLHRIESRSQDYPVWTQTINLIFKLILINCSGQLSGSSRCVTSLARAVHGQTTSRLTTLTSQIGARLVHLTSSANRRPEILSGEVSQPIRAQSEGCAPGVMLRCGERRGTEFYWRSNQFDFPPPPADMWYPHTNTRLPVITLILLTTCY